MTKKGIFGLLILLLVAGGAYWYLNVYSKSTSKTVHQLTVGIQNSPSNSLIIIADRKGFFDTTKVKVTVKQFSAGKLALQALLGQANDIDVAVCAETPIALSTLGKNKINVFTEIVNAKNECRVVVRKDGNLNTPETYFSKKRKLATSQGGSPEWLTYNFINQFKLDKSKIEILAMLPENMPAALSSKSVDGISIFDPFARIGEKDLGANGLTFLNNDISSYYVMSTKDSTLTQKSIALEELLKGLLKAEEFIKTNTEEAKQIIAEQTKLDLAIINETWSNYNFSVSLGNPLIELLKAESNWAIETGKYPKETPIPDFKAVIKSEILKKISPAKVGL
jgi:ABC-type nitrate/sulfonate/bicarbonate transport system substrate-binding protein